MNVMIETLRQLTNDYEKLQIAAALVGFVAHEQGSTSLDKIASELHFIKEAGKELLK